LSPPDVHCRKLAQLATNRLEPRGHEVEELARGKPERRPVELVVCDEPVVLGAAAAVESDAEDGWMGGTGESLDGPGGRERDLRLPPHGARKGVAARERIVHADVVETTPDGEAGVSVGDQRKQVVLR